MTTPADPLLGIRHLAAAVLARAFDDASRRGETAARAKAWLAGNSETLELWCRCAGVPRRQVLERLARGSAPRGTRVRRPAPRPAPWDADDEIDGY